MAEPVPHYSFPVMHAFDVIRQILLKEAYLSREIEL